MIADKDSIPAGWSIPYVARPEPVRRGAEESGDSQVDRLIRLARERYELGRTTDGGAFAIAKDGPRVARPLRGDASSIRADLARAYFERFGKAASTTALADVLLLAEGYAVDLPARELHLRYARGANGEVFIDLGDESGAVVRVDATGWTVESGGDSILFRRTELTAPMPRPEPGGNLEALRGLLNVTDAGWPLLVGWCLAAMLADIPRPVLLLTGEQGAGKSSAAAMLAQLVDPSPAPLRAPPEDVAEWIVGANGSAVVAIDNLSTISDWLSDALCRACTGDGLVKRRLYTDAGLAVVTFRRAVLLTGIDLAGLRGDLAERLLSVELVRLEAAQRRTHAELWEKFNAARASLFGALLTLLSDVLRELPNVNPETLPRMADFARVLMAVDQAWETDALRTYLAAAGSLAVDVLESDQVARALAGFLPAVGGAFTGTAAELLGQLPPPTPLPHSWPRNPKAIAARLRRLAPAMRSVGYELDSPTQATRTPGTRSRIWRIVAPKTDSPPTSIGEDHEQQHWTEPGHDVEHG